jgi:hypothetical protein
MLFYFTFPMSSYDKLSCDNGTIVVNEEIRGDFDIVAESTRCSLDMKTCEKFSTLRIRDACKLINDKNAFYSAALEKISPQIKCPIKPGKYYLSKTSADLSILSLLSLDGYVWMDKITFSTNDIGSKTKKRILCINAETKITKMRVKS